MKLLITSWPRSWLAAALCLMACLSQAQSLEVIDLRYRTAAELIPVLQPLLEEGGAISGQDYKLFVRASAGNVAELKRALAQLDRQPRQLRVSVRRASRQTIERESMDASAVIGSRGTAATVHATDGSALRDGSNISSVQVLEGGSAYIASGQSIPVVTAAITGGGRRSWTGVAAEYRDVHSGFLVTPRVSAQRVTLEIEQQANEIGSNGSRVRTQGIATQVSGELGQWLSLGGVSESANARETGIGSRRYATQSDDVTVWVRVEEM